MLFEHLMQLNGLKGFFWKVFITWRKAKQVKSLISTFQTSTSAKFRESVLRRVSIVQVRLSAIANLDTSRIPTTRQDAGSNH